MESTAAVHECVLMEQFLYSMTGVILPEDSGANLPFPKNDPLDHMNRLLQPTRLCMKRILGFIDRQIDSGTSQICDAIADRISQFVMNIMLRAVSWEADMRNGRMTMSSLRYQIGETNELLDVMVEIIEAIDSTMDAGEKVDVLADFSHLHGEVKVMCAALSEAAFEPMGTWLLDVVFAGSVSSDLYSEFFISDQLERKETCSIPAFLTRVVDDAIACGRNARILSQLGVSHGLSKPAYSPELMDTNNAHLLVKKTLRNTDTALFRSVSFELKNCIKEMSRVFFISESDWFMDFIESAGIELEKPVKLISKTKLNGWLKLALDETEQNLAIDFHTFQLDQMNNQLDVDRTDDMMGLRALTINWRTNFPMSLIFTQQMVFKLQCIFRHLFYCKSVDLKLSQLWLEFQSVRQFENGSLIPSNLLLQEMNHFVKNYLFYLSIDVVEAKMSIIKEQVAHSDHSIFVFSKNLDEVLSQIVSEFNLTTPVFKLLTKVLSTCALFSSHIRRFLALQPLSESMAEITQQERYISMFEKFRDAFQGQMNSLLVQLKLYERTSSGNLIARLDFNEYFSEVMGI